MKKRSSILWGLLIIGIGIAVLLENFGIDLGLEGLLENWWALFIVIPSVISIIERPSFFNVAALLIGVLFLVEPYIIASGILPFAPRKLIWPIILVFIGLSIIFRRTGKAAVEVNIETDKDYTEQCAPDGGYSYSVVFGGDSYRLKGELHALKASAVFGGLDFDLSQAQIADGTHLKVSAVFGGVNIILPKDINLITKGTPVFGGIDASGYRNDNNVVSPTVYLDYTCTFGGIDVKTAK